MKNITILLISMISFSNIAAQKYTKTYIKNANQVALEWLKDINNNNYEIAYEILSDEIKERYAKKKKKRRQIYFHFIELYFS